MILGETLDIIRTKYENQFKTTTIKRVNLGLLFTAIELSSGYCGLASTDLSLVSCCTPNRKKDFGDFSPGKISGQKLLDLFNYTGGSKVLDIVRLAAINAVSAELIAKSKYKIIEDKDPVDLVELSDNMTVCVVGAFQTYIKNIASTPMKLFILELNENAIPDEYKKHFIPVEEATGVFQQSDVIIITGSSLMNNTLDNMLDKIPPSKKVIVVGPTAGLIPDVLFKHGIDIIGSTRVIDADKVFHTISEGGAGYHLFHNGAQKICLLNETI